MRMFARSPFCVGLFSAACMPALVLFATPAHGQDPVLSQITLDKPAPGMATITGPDLGKSKSEVTVKFGDAAATLKLWTPAVIIVYIPASGSPNPVDIVLTVDKTRFEDLGSFTIPAASQPASLMASARPAEAQLLAPVPPPPPKRAASPPAAPAAQDPAANPPKAPENAPKAPDNMPLAPENPAQPDNPAGAGAAPHDQAQHDPAAIAISKFSPANGEANINVTITGSGFGSTQGKSKVTLGGQTATVAKGGWSDTKIVVAAPDFNADKDLPLKVSVSVVDAAGNPAGVVTADAEFTENPATWSDKDEKPFDIRIVGGYEQGFQSAQAGTSDAFLAVYGRSLFRKNTLGPFYSIRLQTAPQASNTYGVVSVLTSPSSAITTQSLQSVGSAVDLDLGLEYQFKHKFFHRQTTLSFIGGGGFVTPLQANSINATYTMPGFGTVECTELQSRFNQNGVLKSSIYAGITPNTAPGSASCFTNNIGVASGSTGTSITTLEYAAPDRPNYFPKYFAGLRIVNRFPGASGVESCNKNTPCERGYVDFSLGQNASISGGSLKHLVVNVDSIYPMPIPSLNFLYFFGSASERLHNLPANQSPLVLQVPSPVPTPGSNPLGTLVVPLAQPDRDFYRIGIGISLNQIFTALKPAAASAP